MFQIGTVDFGSPRLRPRRSGFSAAEELLYFPCSMSHGGIPVDFSPPIRRQYRTERRDRVVTLVFTLSLLGARR